MTITCIVVCPACGNRYDFCDEGYTPPCPICGAQWRAPSGCTIVASLRGKCRTLTVQDDDSPLVAALQVLSALGYEVDIVNGRQVFDLCGVCGEPIYLDTPECWDVESGRLCPECCAAAGED